MIKVYLSLQRTSMFGLPRVTVLVITIVHIMFGLPKTERMNDVLWPVDKN